MDESRLGLEKALTIVRAWDFLNRAQPVLNEVIAKGNLAEIQRCANEVINQAKQILDGDLQESQEKPFRQGE